MHERMRTLLGAMEIEFFLQERTPTADVGARMENLEDGSYAEPASRDRSTYGQFHEQVDLGAADLECRPSLVGEQNMRLVRRGL